MERLCFQQIKSNEKNAGDERVLRREKEKIISLQRVQPVSDEVFSKILEKSIY